MKRFILLTCVFVLGILMIARSSSFGFGEIAGSCEKDCLKCHQLTKEEAADLINGLATDLEVLDVRESPVRGLWEVALRSQGQKGLAYIDYSKGTIIFGSIIELKTKINRTQERYRELTRIDVSIIPLDNALVMGNRDAKYRVVVFDDPG